MRYQFSGAPDDGEPDHENQSTDFDRCLVREDQPVVKTVEKYREKDAADLEPGSFPSSGNVKTCVGDSESPDCGKHRVREWKRERAPELFAQWKAGQVNEIFNGRESECDCGGINEAVDRLIKFFPSINHREKDKQLRAFLDRSDDEKAICRKPTLVAGVILGKAEKFSQPEGAESESARTDSEQVGEDEFVAGFGLELVLEVGVLQPEQGSGQQHSEDLPFAAGQSKRGLDFGFDAGELTTIGSF